MWYYWTVMVSCVVANVDVKKKNQKNKVHSRSDWEQTDIKLMQEILYSRTSYLKKMWLKKRNPDRKGEKIMLFFFFFFK